MGEREQRSNVVLSGRETGGTLTSASEIEEPKSWVDKEEENSRSSTAREGQEGEGVLRCKVDPATGRKTRKKCKREINEDRLTKRQKIIQGTSEKFGEKVVKTRGKIEN